MQKAPAERAPKVEGKIHSGMKAIFFLKKIEKKNPMNMRFAKLNIKQQPKKIRTTNEENECAVCCYELFDMKK